MKNNIPKDRYTEVHTKAQFHPDGMIELYKTDKQQPDENTYLKRNDIIFHNGTIDVDVCGRLRDRF